MASNRSKNIFATTYKDDFLDSDNYHRILFNSGRALQARELTQLQTIIQREIERFGRNIFKDGAAVDPISNIFVNKIDFVKLASGTLPAAGTELTGATSGVVAVVRETIAAADGDPDTLLVDYTDTSSGTPGATPVTFTAGETLNPGGLVIAGSNAFGKSTKGLTGEGVFFVQGHFVYSEAQETIVSKYSSTPTDDLGFKVEERILTTDDDAALYDNQGAVPNITAPGADRYQIKLTLTARSKVTSSDNFVYTAKIVDGEVVSTNNGRGDYNKVLDLVAQRTYEESGNYTVKPFVATFEEDSANTHLNLLVDPGIAYVNGYRAQPLSSRIRVEKPTDTITITDAVAAANYGNYLLADKVKGDFDTNNFAAVDLRSDSAYLGSTIGSARIRAVTDAPNSEYRYYLFDVNMNSGKNFRNVQSFGNSATNYVNIAADSSQTTLTDIANNNLFFNLPNNRPSFTDTMQLDMKVHRRYTTTVNGSGEGTIAIADAGAGDGAFTDITDWIVTVDSSEPLAFTTSGSVTSQTITVGGYTSGTMSVQAFVQRQNITERNKVLTNATADLLIESDGTGTAYLNLGEADIYRLNSAVDSAGNDVSVDYTLDNGQRDNFYALGKLILNTGTTPPAARISVDFDYFEHSGTGNYFNAASYNNGGFAYKDIPAHRLQTGELVNLRDVLDFRSRINDAGTGFSGTGAVVNEVPENTSLLDGDMKFYLPRRDRLVVNYLGEVEYYRGTPRYNPEYPLVPQPYAMNLYDIQLNGNTLNVRDTFLDYVDNKRYTMRDIGRLEQKIEENRESISLSLLELQTENLEVLDANGNNRTKSGFFVDNFRNNISQDTLSNEHTAAVDIEISEMRPSGKQVHVSPGYDSASSSNVVLKKNSVFLNYDEEVYIDQSLASDLVNVNPFDVINNEGFVILTPERDDWVNTTLIEEVVDTASAVLSGGQTFSLFDRIDPNWLTWDWGWWGRNGFTGTGRNNTLGDQVTNQSAREFLRANNITLGEGQNIRDFRRLFSRIAIQVEGPQTERTVQQISVPFMRSREVAFIVKNVRPNTQHFAFFDNVAMASWVRSLNTSDYNTLLSNIRSNPDYRVIPSTGLTAHPDGATTLTSDATGTIRGSFFLPSNEELNFRSGTKTLAFYNINTNNASLSDSKASAEFTSTGLEETITERTSDVVRLRRYDPLAQTFYNDKTHSIFVTSVGVYLGSVDQTRDLTCEIRPVVNGYPSGTERLRHAVASLSAAELSGAASSNATVKTTFTFERPIELKAETEYAIVLLSQSTGYTVWVATMGNFLVGSTTLKVVSQPTLGSLFKSQNGTTWEPSQNQDLTFDLSIADFTRSSLSGEAKFAMNDFPNYRLRNNPFYVDSASNSVRVYHPFHGMLVGDKVLINHFDSASADSDHLRGITDGQIQGLQTITAKDVTGYTFTSSGTSTSGGFGGGNFWQATQQAQIDVLYTGFQVHRPDGSDATAKIKLTSGQSEAGSELAYVYDTSYTDIVINSNNYFSARKMLVNSQNKTAQSMSESDDLRIIMTTTNKYVSPVVDALNTSLHCITNIIDDQDSAGLGGNQPLTYTAENTADGGSSIAKYVTKTVTLENEAVGLKVLIGANKPSVASFDVYYKTAGVDETIADNSWVLAEVDNLLPSDDDGVTFREYRYTIGGTQGTLDPFVQFKIKIVMRTQNNLLVPRFRDLRAIALTV